MRGGGNHGSPRERGLARVLPTAHLHAVADHRTNVRGYRYYFSVPTHSGAGALDLSR